MGEVIIRARMTPAEISCYQEQLEPCAHIVEFGIGGSTLIAVEKKNLVEIHSVESDRNWIDRLRTDDRIRSAESAGRLFLRYADIGQTGRWGRPIGAPSPAWRGYYEDVWAAVEPATLDLVLVDGRFRVQSALTAALRCKVGTRVVVHDYYSRSYYHVIEDFFDHLVKVDDLAVFAVKEHFDRNGAQAIIDKDPYRTL